MVFFIFILLVFTKLLFCFLPFMDVGVKKKNIRFYFYINLISFQCYSLFDFFTRVNIVKHVIRLTNSILFGKHYLLEIVMRLCILKSFWMKVKDQESRGFSSGPWVSCFQCRRADNSSPLSMSAVLISDKNTFIFLIRINCQFSCILFSSDFFFCRITMRTKKKK